MPPSEDDLLAHQTDLLLGSAPTYVVVTAGSGLTGWVDSVTGERRQAVLDLMSRTPLVARGGQGASALQALGLKPVFVAPRDTAAEVVDWLTTRVGAGDTIGVQQHGGEGPSELATLQRRGVATVTVYRWVLPIDSAPAQRLIDRIIDGDIDVLACTSAPSIRLLFEIAGQDGAVDSLRAALRNGTAPVVIGNITAAVEELGVPVALMPTRPRTNELVGAIAAWGQRRNTSSGPLELEPSARAVRAGSRVVVFGQAGVRCAGGVGTSARRRLSH